MAIDLKLMTPLVIGLVLLFLLAVHTWGRTARRAFGTTYLACLITVTIILGGFALYIFASGQWWPGPRK
jgi:hypothetical protein